MKFSKIIAVFGLSLLLPALQSAAKASDQVEAHVVKVESGLCTQGSKFKGSGLLFKEGDKVYVLTSDHVLLNGNEKICHQVSNPTVGTLSARLLSSDWGVGLALLEVTGKPKAPVTLSLDDFQKKSPVAGSSVTVAGYPYALRNLVREDDGKVLVSASSRHVFAHNIPMIEVFGTHAEFGMSGGAVFDRTGNQVVGILSHQVLEMVGGRATVATEMKSGNGARIFNHVLIISAEFATSWVESYFASGRNFVPSIVQSMDEQLLGQSSVITDGLEFSFTTAREAGIGGKGGGDPTGIGGKGGGDPTGIGGKGGGDPTGIGGKGGGDPTGIGGFESAAISDNDNVITVRIAPPSAPSASLGRLDRMAWMRSMREALLLQKVIAIPYLYSRDPQTRQPSKIRIESLAQFFRALAPAEVRPVTRVFVAKAGALVEEGAVHSPFAIEPFKTSIVSTLKTSRDLLKGSASVDERLLLNRIVFTLEILSSSEWDSIPAREVEEIIRRDGTFGNSWTLWFQKDFDSAVGALRLLGEVKEELNRKNGLN